MESTHRVHVAVVDASGRLRFAAGDPGLPVFYRSAAKPLQALPLVEDGVADRYGLSPAELALCCASHNSEPRHVEAARRILARAGLHEGLLACGGHSPLRAEEGRRIARAGRAPLPVESNCSGKHAGMLALAAHHGWPTEGYHRADHPVQRRMAHELERWTGLAPGMVETAVDGCGVVCFRVPLERLALSFARFADAAFRGEGPRRVVDAMTGHPGMVGGVGRLDSAVMEASAGAVFAKVGAEGVYAAGMPSRGLGVVLKVEDGAGRAADAALVRMLDDLGWLPRDGETAVSPFRDPILRNTRGEEVGRVETRFHGVLHG